MSPPWFASTQTTQHAERFGQAASASSRRRQLTESLALATRPPAWPGRKGRGRFAPGLQLDSVVLVGDDVGVRVATAPAGESGGAGPTGRVTATATSGCRAATAPWPKGVAWEPRPK